MVDPRDLQLSSYDYRLPEERIAQVIQLKSYEDAPYLVLATRNGLVKKSKLTDFDSNRSGGIVAVNLRDGDELVGAVLCSADDDLLLVSAKGQSIRFSATDEVLRPMGRATSGVQGMRFNTDDALLSLNVVRDDTYLLVATSGATQVHVLKSIILVETLSRTSIM